jgi:hypothetical protein
MDDSNLNEVIDKIAESAREISKHSTPILDLTNPIHVYEFYLALIYVFDPIPKNVTLSIIKKLAGERGCTVAESVINFLINEKKVILNTGDLSTTEAGMNDLIYLKNNKKRARQLVNLLTDLRLKALNITLRKQGVTAWGEAIGP